MQHPVTISRKDLNESEKSAVEYNNQHHATHKIKRTDTVFDVYCDCFTDFSVEVAMGKAVNVKCGNCNSSTLIHNKTP
jgi:hypothetical protein